MSVLRPLIAAAGLLALGACATKVPDRIANARTPTEHFAARVVSGEHAIALAVHAQGLSPNQVAALGEFAADWRDGDGGLIVVSAPAGGEAGRAASRTAEGARGALIGQGVGADRLKIESYDAKGDPAAPVRIAYVRAEAVIPKCGRAWTNLSKSAANEVQPNFGCAVTANMAAQIANPADLARPRTAAPADAERRATVLEKYRKGQVTSAEADDKAKGAVSNVVR